VSGIRIASGAAIRDVRIEAGAAEVDGRRASVTVRELGGTVRELCVDGVRHRVAWSTEGDAVFVWCDGRTWVLSRGRPERAARGTEQGGDLRAPMPGRVRRVAAAAGEQVTKGQVLLVLEAMKMEHAIRAPRDGAVRAVHVREGDLVEAGVELAEIQ